MTNLASTSTSVRLIATDIDGTLLLPDGTISARTRAVMQKLTAHDITIVLVSARPPRGVRLIAQALGLGGIAICGNGAIVYDLDQDTILSHVTIPPEASTHLIYTLRAALPGTMFAWEDGFDVTCETEFATHHQALLVRQEWQAQVVDTSTQHTRSIIKLLVTHTAYSDILQLQDIVSTIIGAGYTVTHSGPYFLEIAAKGVDKVLALSQLCTTLAIKQEEVIAFGDMPNDLAMLQWAGRGIAVANAHPLLISSVNEITHSNSDDGVAHILETLLCEA